MAFGGVVVPLLPDFTTENVHHLLEHSESKALFVADSLYEGLEEDKLGDLALCISTDDFSIKGVKANNAFITGLFSDGTIRFLYTFSITRGTIKIRCGFTSLNAFNNICGDGTLVTIVMWQPKETGNRISNANPNMCAIGRNDTKRFPAFKGMCSRA